jgi:hypothetical protein
MYDRCRKLHQPCASHDTEDNRDKNQLSDYHAEVEEKQRKGMSPFETRFFDRAPVKPWPHDNLLLNQSERSSD